MITTMKKKRDDDSITVCVCAYKYKLLLTTTAAAAVLDTSTSTTTTYFKREFSRLHNNCVGVRFCAPCMPAVRKIYNIVPF